MIKFKEFDVGDNNYEEQLEQFQTEHPTAEFVQNLEKALAALGGEND